jgi:N-acetylglucosaminyldiphosphoundecaprenol N-acetyl-beta-D-mannosaminyltransferase
MVENRMLGVRIGCRSLPELVAASEQAIADRTEPFVFACANPHSLVVAQRDADFCSALNRASAVVADGVGCVLAAKFAHIPVGPRVTGFDYFAAVMSSLNHRGGRVFFFGSRDGVLAKLVERLKRDYPRVVAATRSPPFRQWSDEENLAMVDEIRRFDPDVLWVGMTAPKQEKWVSANAARLKVPVIASIGAVFDYYAGVTIRAPEWICKLGLEWLYRLPREPKRLWRRTFISAPLFLWFVMVRRTRGAQADQFGT